eukprot:TRINITY_DN11296_c0_g1_i7.p1 TRINITY_DN11296_c0_g1~~TRINITY_DN11296_c0_g1_i7.p1  ORF type:complete len:790 (-),score=132.11 TRINITY_DN11296_c0_g1_i7:69-2438(-)
MGLSINRILTNCNYKMFSEIRDCAEVGLQESEESRDIQRPCNYTSFPTLSASHFFRQPFGQASNSADAKTRSHTIDKKSDCNSPRGLLFCKYTTKPKFNSYYTMKRSRPKSTVSMSTRNTALQNAKLNDTIKVLELNNMNLLAIPPELFERKGLKQLRLDNNHITSIPDEIKVLANLELLDLSFNELRELNGNLGNLEQLRVLKLNDNKLMNWPDWLCTSFPYLQLLYVHNNQGIASVPASFSGMRRLISFSFDWVAYLRTEQGVALHDKEGRIMIEQIRTWCSKSSSKTLSFLSFYTHFKGIKRTPDETTISLFYTSAQLGHAQILQELLHFNLSLSSHNYSQALLIAIRYNKLECVKALVQAGLEDINAEQPLHKAIDNDCYEIAEYLAQQPGIDNAARDSNGNTPLHLLFMRFDSSPQLIWRACNAVLKKRVNMNEKNEERNTPLHVGILKRQHYAITFAADYNRRNGEGFDFLTPGGENDALPLHKIASHMKLETIYETLSQSIDVLKKDSAGRIARYVVKDIVAAKFFIKKEKGIIKRRLLDLDTSMDTILSAKVEKSKNTHRTKYTQINKSKTKSNSKEKSCNITDKLNYSEDSCNLNDDISTTSTAMAALRTKEIPRKFLISTSCERVNGESQTKWHHLCGRVAKGGLRGWAKYRVVYWEVKEKRRESKVLVKYLLKKMCDFSAVKTDLFYLLGVLDNHSDWSLVEKSESNPGVKNELVNLKQLFTYFDSQYNTQRRETMPVKSEKYKEYLSQAYDLQRSSTRNIPLFRINHTVDYFTNKIH